jgi:hypothetical protein
LLLDVLMQGLDAQGSLSWKGRKPIFIDTARLTRDGEIDKHLFYFGKGTPGLRLRLERDREKLKRLTRQLAHAASYADEVQDEWLSYQALMRERLPAMAARGTELRDLIEEVEGLTESVDCIEGSPRDAAPAFAAPPRPAGAGAVVYPGFGGQGRPRVAEQGRRAPSGTRRAQVRGRRDRRLRGGLPGLSRPVALGVGAAVLLAALVALVVGFLGDRLGARGPETTASAVEGAAGLAGPGEPESGTSGAVAASTREAPAGPESTSVQLNTGGPGNPSARGAATEPASTDARATSAERRSANAQETAAKPPGTGAAEAAPSNVAQERAALGRTTSE